MGHIRLIKVEDRFQEMFNLLPSMAGINANSSDLFDVTFGYGDNKQLNFFLNERKDFVNYPLIWLLYPYKERHTRKYVELEKVSLILAVETITGLTNKERIDQTFTKILFPLFDNISELFMKSNTIHTGVYYDVIKYPNYGEINQLRTKEESFSVDVWDALKVTFDCEINNNCLRPIKFN